MFKTANKTEGKNGFGTGPVFIATISTILGAILFLRFGYAVGHVGFWGTIAIIAIGHVVTIATAMAVAEIATNQRVEGGGAYYIISRSFGLNIGAAIGIALFLAQAISVAFYVIAFAEAFEPLIPELERLYGFTITDKRMISIPTMALLTVILLTKGANVGVKALYVVAAVLFVSLIMFFMGSADYETTTDKFLDKIEDGDPFFYVFTIIFPAFTGIAAGLGFSGDLKNPKRSIPLGTLSATLVGMVVYVFIAIKLTTSASPADLATDQLVMSKIAIWGPIIPIGLACATISSALGSILIAPRTLQALGKDNAFPSKNANELLATGRKRDAEPVFSGMITCAIAFFFIAVGDINFVAEIISMFFMVTYGAICLISFLEYFAADPAYRPSFKSKWYISLIGAVLCFWLMLQMNLTYALVSISIMALLYLWVSYYNKHAMGLADIFRGLIFQASRRMQVFLQKRDTLTDDEENWRPFVVCVSRYSFKRFDAFNLLSWIANKYGFGTYIHYMEGYLSKATAEESKLVLGRLIKMAESSKSNVYLDTIISPSYTSAIAQTIQLPGVSGKDNNMMLFEFWKDDPVNLPDIVDNFQLVMAAGFDVCILGSSEKSFGHTGEIHIWLTAADYDNANLMILLSYIILGHKDWRNGTIKIFAVFPEKGVARQKEELATLVREGRLPISLQNINVLPQAENQDVKSIINELSIDADLTIIGLRSEMLKHISTGLFEGYDEIGNILFICNNTEKQIT